MTLQQEVRFWRGMGVGATIGAMILVGWLVPTYQRTSAFDAAMARVLVIAGFAELLGLMMLGIGRGLQQIKSPHRRPSPIGLAIAALGVVGLGLATPASMHSSPMFVPFAIFSALLLAGGIAMLGTERLLKHFTTVTRRAAIDETVPA